MVLTGVRTVGLHGLRWSDFDFEKRLIHIRRNRLSTDGFGMGPNDSMVTLEVNSHFIPDTQEKVVFVLNNISKKNDYKSFFQREFAVSRKRESFGKNTALPY